MARFSGLYLSVVKQIQLEFWYDRCLLYWYKISKWYDEQLLCCCWVKIWKFTKNKQGVSRSRPNWIVGPQSKLGSAGKSESRGPETRVSRWRRPNSDIYSQNYHFGLVMTYINFLAWRQRIISSVCFANNAIHPWPQVMPIFNREMPPGFTPAICLRFNFCLYLQFGEWW